MRLWYRRFRRSIQKITAFEECVNFGNLTAIVPVVDGVAKPGASVNYMGGIVGMCDKEGGSKSTYSIYTKCVNYGDINAYSSKSVRLGGIIGDSRNQSFKMYECVNFGDITSHDVGLAEHRVGGISGGGNNANFELYDCVNFGDVKGSCAKYGQPSGGILALVMNDQRLALVNCMNYGDVDVAVTAIVDGKTLTGPSVGGLCGRAYGENAQVVITGSINAGNLISNNGIADIFIWTKTSEQLNANAIDINNIYYIPVQTDNTIYAPFLHSDEYTDEDGNSLIGIQSEFSAKATQISKSDLEDGTPVGLAARMTAASQDGTTFKCVKFLINDKTDEKITCVVSEAVATLIADRIVTE